MRIQQLHRITGKLILVLSLTALLTVLSGYTQPRHPAPTDEGAAAHMFQLAIVALVPAILLFLFTADWKQGRQATRPLAVPAITLAAAFAALYCLEHIYFL